jgi:hypothetical protein
MLYKLDGTNHEDSPTFAGKVQTSNITSGVDMYYYDPRWKRNPSWLPLPNVSGQQKFVGLHAIWPDSNFLALSVTGAYTVDWGDGTIENFASGVTAYHQYDYNNANLAGTNAPVTLTDTGDIITRTSHGYSNGDEVRFYGILGTSGLTEGQRYYVISATDNTFQVATSPGGSAVVLTGDGVATLLPYKQAVVTIVPNGGNLTGINLNLKHNQSGLQAYSSGWLDIALEGANLTTLIVSTYTQNVKHNMLEQFLLSGSNGITNFTAMFYGCSSLQSIPLLNTAAGTNFSYMFQNCYSLQSIPLLNTAAGTSFTSMFQNCSSLQKGALSGTKYSISYSACKLSAAALNEIYTNLGTASDTQTITVTNNWGTASDDPSIATAKGWTVTE